jgi:3D (Asp-Asp-Asp) domain-containing protein
MTVMAVVTAYQPDHDCAVNEIGTPIHLTATRRSTDTHPYGIAADPSLLPYGTNIIVPDYLDRRYPDRAWQVDDTGGALRQSTKGHGIVHLDLRYRTLWSALKTGRHWTQVWVNVAGWSDAQVLRLRHAAQAGERLRQRGVMP